MNIPYPCKNLEKSWNWKSQEEFRDKTYPQLTRNIFDCALYFFDGIFNVVKFEKGTSFYHGSSILANNVVEFPVGKEFYDSTKPYKHLPELSVVAESPDDIEQIISQYIPIVPSWYGDIHTAKTYSKSKVKNSKVPEICKDNCIFAYKLKQDVVMFLFDDDYNLSKLINHKDFPNEQKKNLQIIFNLKSTIATAGNRYNEVTLKKERHSYYNEDKIFAEYFCKNLSNQLNYAGYTANKQISKFHGGLFHPEFIFCNPFAYLERDLYNPDDWQHLALTSLSLTDIRNTYMVQLSLYESTNVGWHAGNLLEHSVWTLLFCEDIMDGLHGYEQLELKNEEYKKIVAFCAFIHDIGKVEPYNARKYNIYNKIRRKYVFFSVPNHPEIGSKYLDDTLKFPVVNPSNNTFINFINIDDLLNSFNIITTYKHFISNIIKLHWSYGQILKKYNSNQNVDNDITKYIQICINEYKPRNKDDLYMFINALLIVSISDINGANVYGQNRLETDPKVLNKKSKYFDFISNMPKLYKGVNTEEIIHKNAIDLILKIHDHISVVFDTV